MSTNRPILSPALKVGGAFLIALSLFGSSAWAQAPVDTTAQIGAVPPAVVTDVDTTTGGGAGAGEAGNGGAAGAGAGETAVLGQSASAMDVAVLPATGGIPATVLAAIGGILTAAGFAVSRRRR